MPLVSERLNAGYEHNVVCAAGPLRRKVAGLRPMPLALAVGSWHTGSLRGAGAWREVWAYAGWRAR